MRYIEAFAYTEYISDEWIVSHFISMYSSTTIKQFKDTLHLHLKYCLLCNKFSLLV